MKCIGSILPEVTIEGLTSLHAKLCTQLLLSFLSSDCFLSFRFGLFYRETAV